MGKYKNLLLLFVAVLLSGLAAFGAISYIEDQEQKMLAEQEAKANYQNVIVPKFDLVVGDIVSANTVSVRPIPQAYIPDGALRPEDIDSVVGMVLDEPASYGRPLLRGHLKGLSSVEKFSQLIEKGNRSITLNVSSLDTAENLLTVGDYVDILLMVDTSIAPVLDRVMVLATGVTTVSNMYSSPYDDGYSTLTISVKPTDFSKVMAAREIGDLVYALRNPEDLKRASYSQAGESSTVSVFAGGNAKSGMLVQTSLSVSKNARTWEESSDRIISVYKPAENNEGGASDDESTLSMAN